jgi:hypothetical protein
MVFNATFNNISVSLKCSVVKYISYFIPGLVVYDSCGSLKRTLKILGQYINTNTCANVTEIVGKRYFSKL